MMAFGKYHAGALEQCMKLLQEIVKDNLNKDLIESQDSAIAVHIEDMAFQLVENYLKEHKRIPGYGHRYHKQDPRAPKLIKLAKKHGFYSVHTRLAVAIEKNLYERKNILLNVDGANAGILSDMGFDWQIGTGIFMIGRLPALISHVHEEKTQETPFRKIIEADEIYYNGIEDKTSNKDSGTH
jgi:citrate synthase